MVVATGRPFSSRHRIITTTGVMRVPDPGCRRAGPSIELPAWLLSIIIGGVPTGHGIDVVHRVHSMFGSPVAADEISRTGRHGLWFLLAFGNYGIPNPAIDIR
ncbi:hypothetical protein [Nocardia noduli]|uniref:hypothetical protein n=1 Tax=Nocardia noduli TaxID=2815722 RepID=UPI001C238E72|nr:hypothetical protein [Nocardia noduli]